MLLAHPHGNYHFLKGIDPYSCGVIADPGFEIVHVVLRDMLPWREAFDAIDQHLKENDRPRSALCGAELRSPAPFTMQGFIDFNRDYCQILKQWDLYVGELNPVARTNVAPFHAPPSTPSLHAFSYIAPNTAQKQRTLVVAGAGELREGILVEEGIIRSGDTSPGAMREKAAYVMQVMEERLLGLGGGWDLINAVDVYTVHPMDDLIEGEILDRMGPATRHGVRWLYTRPPVVDIEFEMDMRGVAREYYI
jgi:hypothetical protein